MNKPIVNRLQSITNMVNKNWIHLSRDTFKSMCKKHICNTIPVTTFVDMSPCGCYNRHSCFYPIIKFIVVQSSSIV